MSGKMQEKFGQEHKVKKRRKKECQKNESSVPSMLHNQKLGDDIDSYATTRHDTTQD
jgi:hypothetical protein